MLVLNEDGISPLRFCRIPPKPLLPAPHHDSEQVSITASKVSTSRGKLLQMSRATSNYPTPSDFASNQISLDTRLFPIRAQTQLLASAAAVSIKEPPHLPPPIVVTANRGERRATKPQTSYPCVFAASLFLFPSGY